MLVVSMSKALSPHCVILVQSRKLTNITENTVTLKTPLIVCVDSLRPSQQFLVMSMRAREFEVRSLYHFFSLKTEGS